jgi:hypothetical protein
MLVGSEEDLRSPLFSKKGPKGDLTHLPYDIIKGKFAEVLRHVDPTQRGLTKAQLGILTIWENAQAESWGSKSTHLPWMEDGETKVKAIYSDKPQKKQMNVPAYRRALDRIQSMVPSNSIRMTDLETAVKGRPGRTTDAFDTDGMDTTTNSGPPHYRSPFKPTDDQNEEDRRQSEASYQYIMSKAKKLLPGLHRGRVPKWWAVASQRIVSKGPDPLNPKKKRLVIALEKTETVIWKTITPQAIDALKLYSLNGVRPLVALYDRPQIINDCQVMLNDAHRMGLTVLSGDLSGFDASIPPWMISNLGPILDSWLHGSTKIGSALTKALSNQVGLITPSRIYDQQPSSMKSGSGFTNLGDSLVNMSALYYGEEIGLYKIHSFSVQGDDFIILGEGISPDSVSEAFSHFGMEAHPDKQMYERDTLSYLQKLHFRGYYGDVASVYRVMISALTYERIKFRPDEWSWAADVVRNLSQLENAVFSPYFEETLKFAASGDKFNLGSSYEPTRLLALSGDAGIKSVKENLVASWKGGNLNAATPDGFTSMAVNGVLRGELLPPHGSAARFKRAFGKRINA